MRCRCLRLDWRSACRGRSFTASNRRTVSRSKLVGKHLKSARQRGSWSRRNRRKKDFNLGQNDRLPSPAAANHVSREVFFAVQHSENVAYSHPARDHAHLSLPAVAMGIRGRIWRDPGAGGCTPSVNAEIHSVQIKLPGGPFCFGSSDIDLWGVVTPVSLPAFLALCDRLSNLLEPQHALGRIIDLYCSQSLKLSCEVASNPNCRCRIAFASPVRVSGFVAPRRDRSSRGRSVMYRFMNMSRIVMRAPLDAHQTRILSKSLLNIDQEWRRRPSGFAGSSQYGAVIATAHDSARGRLLNSHGHAQAPDVLAAALEAADAIGAEFSAPSDKSGEFAPTEYAAAPMGLELAIAKVTRPITRLCADIAGMLTAVMLGGIRGLTMCGARISSFARACRRPIA